MVLTEPSIALFRRQLTFRFWQVFIEFRPGQFTKELFAWSHRFGMRRFAQRPRVQPVEPSPSAHLAVPVLPTFEDVRPAFKSNIRCAAIVHLKRGSVDLMPLSASAPGAAFPYWDVILPLVVARWPEGLPPLVRMRSFVLGIRGGVVEFVENADFAEESLQWVPHAYRLLLRGFDIQHRNLPPDQGALEGFAAESHIRALDSYIIQRLEFAAASKTPRP